MIPTQSVIETFLSQEQSAHDAMNYYIGGCREGSTFTWITGEAFDYSNVSDTTFIKKKINLSINGLEDGVYSFTTNYYLLDCYDFEPTNDLYLLNAKGLAKNFVSIGKDSFEGTFTADGAITIK